MSKPMVYGLASTHGEWHEVRLTTNDRKGSHGAALYRWRSCDRATEKTYNMEWYGVSRGVGDWYQGDSDRNMTDEFFDARLDLIEDCLDGLAYGMSANDIRAALSAYLMEDDS